jgi:hypothetical protein
MRSPLYQGPFVIADSRADIVISSQPSRNKLGGAAPAVALVSTRNWPLADILTHPRARRTGSPRMPRI